MGDNPKTAYRIIPLYCLDLVRICLLFQRMQIKRCVCCHKKRTMNMRIFWPPKIILVSLVLNLVTFAAFVFTGSQQENDGLFIIKNLFVATLIFTVCSLAFVNINTSLKMAKDFFMEKQYIKLLGQTFVISVIVFMAVIIVLNLFKNIFHF